MSFRTNLFRALRFGFAAGLLMAGARADVRPGDLFPSLAGADLNGGVLPVTAGKVVLVDFWASWCAPCKASFPIYARIQSDYAARGLVIVAVSVDEKASDFAAFVHKLAPPFATVRDQSQKLVASVDVPTMPTSFLLGRDGKVRFMHVGFYGAETDKTIRAELDRLLAEGPSP
jgi:thiol-disulfide isomerase/thioredoxin